MNRNNFGAGRTNMLLWTGLSLGTAFILYRFYQQKTHHNDTATGLSSFGPSSSGVDTSTKFKQGLGEKK